MTEADITRALENKYCLPEWSFLAQVSDRIGGANRYADGIAMNLYPSRGLEVIGFEIKTARGDLRKELNDPAKAEQIAKFCNTWFIVIPEGMVRADDDIPMGWGVLAVKQDGSIRQTKKPIYKQAEHLTKEFVASILRRAAEREKKDYEAHVNKIVEARLAMRIEGIENNKKREHERAQDEVKRLREKIDTFEAESGISMAGYGYPKKFGDAVKLLIKLNVTGTFGLLDTLRRDMKKIDETLTVLDEFIGADET